MERSRPPLLVVLIIVLWYAGLAVLGVHPNYGDRFRNLVLVGTVVGVTVGYFMFRSRKNRQADSRIVPRSRPTIQPPTGRVGLTRDPKR